MKVVVSARGKELESRLDPRFGRASYLLFYDMETQEIEVVDNSATNQLAHGAGIQTAQCVLDRHPDLVVSGNFGPKAAQVLQAASIRLATCPEVTISEVLELIRSDKVTPFEG